MNLPNPVNDFIRVSVQVMEYFDSVYDYFIKPLPTHQWSVSELEGAFFLKYWENGKNFYINFYKVI